MKLFKTAVDNAKTHDIIYSLCIAAPAAIAQAKQFNLPEVIGLTGGNLQSDANLTGQWIRNNISYRVDSFENQNIQLPSALLKSKIGDCKSISLLYLSIMEAGGYKGGGFRFAAYRNKNFTHVYNFFADNNNFFTFDACIANLKEHNKHTNTKDMKVNYLAGTPMMISENRLKRRSRIRTPKVFEVMQDDRVMSINGIGKVKFFKKLKDTVNKIIPGGGVNPIRTIALAPARGSFLVLVSFNFRALAKRLAKFRAKNPNKYAEFWTKLGGDIKALDRSVDKAKDKKPFLGEKKGVSEPEYVGSVAAIATALAAAAGIIASLKKMFGEQGVPEEPGAGDIGEGIDPDAPIVPEAEPGEPVIPNDPASKGAAEFITKGIKFVEGLTGNRPKIKYTPPGNRPSRAPLNAGASNVATGDETSTGGFKPSPLLIGGGIAAVAAIYLLTKKKKK
jgi:hypothetical protein